MRLFFYYYRKISIICYSFREIGLKLLKIIEIVALGRIYLS
jgi:hypothetical protein